VPVNATATVVLPCPRKACAVSENPITVGSGRHTFTCAFAP
jgi:hypothetical protein